jgi:hypothetical protein
MEIAFTRGPFDGRTSGSLYDSSTVRYGTVRYGTVQVLRYSRVRVNPGTRKSSTRSCTVRRVGGWPGMMDRKIR